MNSAIVGGLHRLPRDIDLVVGVPRSGLLAANLLSLAANVPMTDLDSFLAGRVYSSGTTKVQAKLARSTAGMRKILVLDDSINTGSALRDARTRLKQSGSKASFTYVAVYGSSLQHADADQIIEVVPQPRLFQWNFMHHTLLAQCCVDIDGVLCEDPSDEENDDGPLYQKFLANARPLYRPTRKIAYLVSSRLERYRPQTQTWLASHGIEYGKLVMLDLPSKQLRQRLGGHSRFKAEFYRRSNASLFIESSHEQAVRIARIAAKPVLCLQSHQMIQPNSIDMQPNWKSSNRAGIEPLNDEWEYFADQRRAAHGGTDDVESIEYLLVDADDHAKPRTLVSCLGEAPNNLQDVIDSVCKACAVSSEFPIVVITELNQGLMAALNTPVEFLPQKRHMPTLTWDAYQRYVGRRWDLILEKWKIEKEIPLAASLEEFLRDQMGDADLSDAG